MLKRLISYREALIKHGVSNKALWHALARAKDYVEQDPSRANLPDSSILWGSFVWKKSEHGWKFWQEVMFKLIRDAKR